MTTKNLKSDNFLLQITPLVAVAASLFMLLIKFWAWYISGSLSVMALLIDSVLDIAVSATNFFAIRLSLMPSDKKHRFGHGKIEAIASLLEINVIFISVLFIIKSAIYGIFYEYYILEYSDLAVYLICISTITNVSLIVFQSWVIRRTNSLLIRVDRLHYMMDVFTNASTIIILLSVGYYSLYILDPILALCESVYIVYSCYLPLKTALSQLMDQECSDDVRQKIIKLVLSHKDVKGMHDLRTRISGKHRFIQLHVELEGSMTLYEAHKISDEVESSLLENIENSEVLIHQDPSGYEQISDHDLCKE